MSATGSIATSLDGCIGRANGDLDRLPDGEEADHGHRDSLAVDKGVMSRRSLAAGPVGRMSIMRITVLLGAGIPRFGPPGRDIPLRPVPTRADPNGLVQSEYEVIG